MKSLNDYPVRRLLKKSRLWILGLCLGQLGLVLLMMILQVILIFAAFIWFQEFLPHVYGGQILLTVGMVLWLLNSRMDPSAKLTWMIVIMFSPVFGSLLYLVIQRDIGKRAMQWRGRLLSKNARQIPMEPNVLHRLAEESPGAAGLARYIAASSGFPVCENSEVSYFPSGEAKLEALLQELEKAESFIFLEYFIINEGEMWGKVLNLLEEKASQGVEVRLIYDGSCELALLPRSYPKMLEKLGIQCKVFSRAMPFVSTHYNYRDHRKIVVIDGRTAFTGGVNLSDEYANFVPKFGHWKDTAVRIRGEAVRSFTVMFLQMWNMDAFRPEDPSKYLNSYSVPGSAYVMPYCDTPLDDERVGQQVYMDILSRANRYVHIMTPYLILDAEMENALKYAAARGVDVRILLPGIPDKTVPYALATTHFRSLLDAGVKLYKYTPGFVHAKSFVCDDMEAVVGTINLDYRSLYHHFECACYMRGGSWISHIEQDFQESISVSEKLDVKAVSREKLRYRILGVLFKGFAPLL